MLGAMGSDFFYAMLDFGGHIQEFEDTAIKIAGTFEGVGKGQTPSMPASHGLAKSLELAGSASRFARWCITAAAPGTVGVNGTERDAVPADVGRGVYGKRSRADLVGGAEGHR
jgi:hypothetical protein